jgi:hypothetical protein
MLGYVLWWVPLTRLDGHLIYLRFVKNVLIHDGQVSEQGGMSSSSKPRLLTHKTNWEVEMSQYAAHRYRYICIYE